MEETKKEKEKKELRMPQDFGMSTIIMSPLYKEWKEFMKQPRKDSPQVMIEWLNFLKHAQDLFGDGKHLEMGLTFLQTQIDQLREATNEKTYDFIGRLTNTMYIKIPSNIVELYGLVSEDMLEVKIKKRKGEPQGIARDNYFELENIRAERQLLEEKRLLLEEKRRLKELEEEYVRARTKDYLDKKELKQDDGTTTDGTDYNVTYYTNGSN